MTRQEAIDYLTGINPQVARLRAALDAVNVHIDQANDVLTAEGLE